MGGPDNSESEKALDTKADSGPSESNTFAPLELLAGQENISKAATPAIDQFDPRDNRFVITDGTMINTASFARADASLQMEVALVGQLFTARDKASVARHLPE